MAQALEGIMKESLNFPFDEGWGCGDAEKDLHNTFKRNW